MENVCQFPTAREICKLRITEIGRLSWIIEVGLIITGILIKERGKNAIISK